MERMRDIRDVKDGVDFYHLQNKVEDEELAPCP